jgi:hypothetical protein
MCICSLLIKEIPQTGTQHLSLFLSNVPAHSAQHFIPYFDIEALSVLYNFVNSLVKWERQFCSKLARYITLPWSTERIYFFNLLAEFNWLPLSRSVELRWLQNIIVLRLQSADSLDRAVEGVGLQPLVVWNWGFESRGGMNVCLLWVLCVVR